MDDLIRRLKEEGILSKGDFALRNGQRSNSYFNIKKAYGNPSLLNELADALYLLMDENREATCIAGYGIGGSVLATVISSRNHLHLTLLRDSQKEYGTRRQIEGFLPCANDKLLIPDDVFTTGGSLKRATEIIKPTGAKIVSYGVILHRGGEKASHLSAPLFWLMTEEEFNSELPSYSS
ncbi:hypothetical protein HYZ97_05225 [Candidatus Pacearchaeota archaeon]|nr:hypothetical protein [Candidatus Pacearchaeota archaeon]